MDMSSSSSSMDSSSSMSMDNTSTSSTMMATMMVAFQNDMNTALYTEAWTPTTIGQYAGTCIFVIALAAIFRGLFAVRAIIEARWLDQEINRRYVAVKGQLPMQDKMSVDSLKQDMVLSANGVEEQVMVIKKRHTVARPWRASVDPVRAIVDTVIAGTGYLL